MQPHEQACARCGRPFLPAMRMPPVYADRAGRHVQTLGILWIVWAAWTALGWLVALPFLVHVFGDGAPWAYQWQQANPLRPDFLFHSMGWLPEILTAVVLIRCLLAVVTGVALLQRAPWARTLALVAAFVTIIKPVTGTLLAIYTLWVLLPARSGAGCSRLSS